MAAPFGQEDVKKYTALADESLKKYGGGAASDAGKVVKGTGAGALAGVTLGTALGTAFPGIGNAIGAAVGLVIGALAGAVKELLGLGPTPEQKALTALHGKLQGQLQNAIQPIPDPKARKWIADAILSQLKKMAPGQVPFCVSGEMSPTEDWGGCALIDINGVAKALENVDHLVQEKLLEYAKAHPAPPPKKKGGGFGIAATLLGGAAVVGLVAFGITKYRASQGAP